MPPPFFRALLWCPCGALSSPLFSNFTRRLDRKRNQKSKELCAPAFESRTTGIVLLGDGRYGDLAVVVGVSALVAAALAMSLYSGNGGGGCE